jgi:CelD/BcsL family acetyltransferase involved in cellulose biosynthesis
MPVQSLSRFSGHWAIVREAGQMFFRDGGAWGAGTAATPPAGWTMEIVGHPDEVCEGWERLEADGVATVYQRRAFVAAWLEAFAHTMTLDPLILVARHEGVAVFVLPLAVECRAGLRVARFVGGSHANHNLPIFCASKVDLLDPATIRGWLAEAARLAGIDVFVFERQPVAWEGVANPLAAVGGRPSPTLAQDVDLAQGFEALLARHNGAGKRKKLRQKEKILAAAGDYEIVSSRDPETCRALLEVFFAQKAARLKEQGITDPFGSAEARRFFSLLAEYGARPDPVIEIAALKAGGAVRAVFGFGVRRSRVSLMILSFSQDDLTRASPGETLLFRLMERFAGAGVTAVDFGVGRERYKDSWADAEIPLVDNILAMTAAGRLYAGAVLARLGLERTVRGTPWLWAGYKAARRLVARPATVTAPAADADER